MKALFGLVCCLLVIGGCAAEMQPEDVEDIELGPGESLGQEGPLDGVSFAQGAAGSGAPVEDEEAMEDEDAMEDEEPLVPKGALYRMYAWTKGNAPRQLEPVSQSICVLSRVSGRFAGSNEWAKIYISGGYWHLDGNSGTDMSLNADAICYDHALFDQGSAVFSSEIQTDANSTVEIGPLTRTAMLAGMRGRFDGGGEYVRVDQKPSAPSTLTAQRGHSSLVRGYARTFHKVTQSTQNSAAQLYRPWYTGPAGDRVDPYQAQEYTASSREAGGSTTRTIMGRVDETLCYFTRLSGDFLGGGERLRIVPYAYGGATRWALEAKSGDGRAYASARCISFALPMLLQFSR